MKILFLGGKRILGNSILKKLSTIRKLEIFTLYRNKAKNKKLDSEVRHIYCDRTDQKKLKEVISKYKFNYIYDNNCYDFKNYKIIKKILLKEKKIFYFFTSSIITYLNFEKIRNEKHFLKTQKLKINKYIPKNLAIAKRKIEIDLLRGRGIKFCILRMHNIIGANDHSEKTSFVKYVNQAYLDKKNISPKSLIQFAYVKDVAKIVKKLIMNIKSGKKIHSVYNVANEPLSFDELISIKRKINKKNNKKFDREIVENLIVDNKKIKANLNYTFSSSRNTVKELFKDI